MKKSISLNGRRHGFRTGLAVKERAEKTVLTFERGAQVYCWSTDRVRGRRVHKP
ncbi:MAG: hypothetical protein ACHQ49_13190 [Elusimicrobiota bacterium]